MKDKLMFAAEVAVVIALITLFQMKVMEIPVIGEFLPGSRTPRA